MLFLFDIVDTGVSLITECEDFDDAQALEASMDGSLKLIGEFVEDGEVHSTVLQ